MQTPELTRARICSITLPWPPSVNSYWRHPTTGKLAGRHLISQEGRAYREAVRALVAESRQSVITGPVRVVVQAFRPDRRRRDLDNVLKSLLDSLTHAGVWQDDDQITDLRIYWADSIGGMVKVEVHPA